MEDYYLDERGLASYFEAQWLDKVRESGFTELLLANSKHVPDSFVASPFFLEAADFIEAGLAKASLAPTNLLEVGPALGRSCYELIKRNPTLRNVTLVEPSERLFLNMRKLLLEPGAYAFPYIKGLKELASIEFDTSAIAATCSHIRFKPINTVFDSMTASDDFDITVCLNVVDQCEEPTKLVRDLQARTRLNGVLALSCSYQWSSKHLKNPDDASADINQYFDKNWKKIGETEIEYRFRFNERFSRLFLSHVVMYMRAG
tara:strand:+ start:890 stop:1669 length:780 start_codon:yes stop_codon:yes gene_type:complete